MALFPRIQSPCPYKGRLSDILDGDVCRLCKRQVHDLSAMDDGARVAFMSGCKDEVCVSYKLPVLAAAALAASVLATPASAQITEVIVFAGGIKDLAHVAYIHVADPADKAVPALPVVYGDPPAPKAKDAPEAGGVKAPPPSAP